MRAYERSVVVVLLSMLGVACSTMPEGPSSASDDGPPAAPRRRATAEQAAVDPRISSALALFAREPVPVQLDETRARLGQVDRAGDVHVVFDGIRKGLRVLGAEIVRHLLADGRVVARDGDEGLALATFDDTPPSVDDAHAAEIAESSMKPLGRVDAARPELVYERHGDRYRMVYRVDVAMNPRDTVEHEWRLWIDPATGNVLRRLDVTRHTEGIGHSRLYGTVPLQTFFYADEPEERTLWGFTLEDWLRPAPGQFIRTSSYYDGNGVMTPTFTTPFIKPQSNDWGNGRDMLPKQRMDPATGPLSPTGETSAVDAHNSSAWAWDLYVHVFNRFGPFGDGSVFDNVVHYTNAWGDPTDASFHTGLRTMFLGTASATCSADTGLQVIGHEIAHGFFKTHVDTTYIGESGGIDEANSDIIGKLTEMYGETGMRAGGPGRQSVLPNSWPSWDLMNCGHLLRSMSRPSRAPPSVDAWSSAIEAAPGMDPHFASGPINRMFYFLANGVEDQTHVIIGGFERSNYLPGGMLGIGVRAAAAVWYEAVVYYLKPSEPKFIDLRKAMEDAAGSNTTLKKAVQDAFAAVNVGPPADRKGPTISGLTTLTAPGATLGATATDPAGIKRVSYSAGTRNWGSALSAPWSITVPADVTAGNYSVEVCADDQLDNRACVTAVVQIDSSGPLIGLFQVTNPFAAGNKTTRLVASDSSGIGWTSIYVGTSRLFLKDYGLATPKTSSIDITPTVVLPAALAEGTQTLEARVKDVFGLTQTRTTTFLLDRTSPHECSFGILKPAYPTNSWPVTTSWTGLYASVSDAVSGIASVAFSFDGVEIGSYSGINDPPNADHSMELRWSNKTVGPHTVGVVCTDRFGFVSSQSTSVLLSYPPVVRLSGIGQAATPTRSFTYNIYAKDSDGLGYIQSSVSCTQSGVHNVTTALSGNPIAYDKNFTVTDLILNETCRAQLTARDRFGLSASVPQLQFIVKDPDPPPVTPGASECNTLLHSGGNQQEVILVDIGKKSGTFDFMRNTHIVPDEIVLRCAEGGNIAGYTWLSPNGCESTNGWISTSLPFSCTTSRIEVTVNPNCAGTPNTLWDISLGCAY